jgi:hypothetical protein
MTVLAASKAATNFSHQAKATRKATLNMQAARQLFEP